MHVEDQVEDAAAQNESSPGADEGQETPGQGTADPSPPQPSERERELERRLTQQGRELAETRRTLQTIQSSVTSITSNLSERDRQDAERREREREAYLQTLPEPQRLAKKLELLEGELKSLRTTGKAAVQTAQTGTASTGTASDPEVDYMRQVARATLDKAQQRFGVTLTRDDIGTLPDTAWADESSFFDAVYDLASKKARSTTTGKSEDTTMAGKNSSETDEQRLRRIVREETGASSSTTPRPAAAKGKKPGEDDVKSAVSTYNSAEGPRGNLKRMKELRAQMKG